MRRCAPLAFVFILCSLFSLTQLQAQVDSVFWFAAPNMTHGHGDVPIFLRFTAFKEPVTVRIDQPSNASFAPIQFDIASNSSFSVDMSPYKSLVENDLPNTVLDRGLRILSTGPINSYYENAAHFNPEIFSLKGQKALGSEFVIPMQDFFPNGNYSPWPFASIDIVATEDDTEVVIIPSDDIVGHAAGDTVVIVLNAGQTYCARSTSRSQDQHLGGTIVTSNKPIAITIKDDSMASGSIYGGCADLGGDQITPVDYIGEEYISIPGALNGPNDAVFVYAVRDQTQVWINGTDRGFIDRGDRIDQFSYGQPMHIQASAPVYVLHMSGFGCEVGLDQLPSIHPCNGSRLVAVNRHSNQPFFINILTFKGREKGFLFNGRDDVIKETDFTEVPGLGGQWMYTNKQISLSDMGVGQAAVIQNEDGPFHLSVIHGGPGTGTMYGYFSGYGEVDVLPELRSTCEDTVRIKLDSTFEKYVWSTGDTTHLVKLTESGPYTVTVTDNAGCVAIDTINIELKKPGLREWRAQICPGEGVRMGGEWFDEERPSGKIILSESAVNGCDSILSVELTFYEKAEGYIVDQLCADESIVVAGQRFSAQNPQDTITLINGSHHGCDSIIYIDLSFFPRDTGYQTLYGCPGDTTWYRNTFFTGKEKDEWLVLPGESRFGCDSVVEVTYRHHPVPETYIEESICFGDTLEWFNKQLHASHPSDTFILRGASQYGCDSVVHVKVFEHAQSIANELDTLCAGESIEVAGQTFDESRTTGSVTLRNASITGCDSTINVQLFYPENHLDIQDTFHIHWGKSRQFVPEYGDDFVSWNWMPSDFLSCSDCESPWVRPTEGMNYLLRGIDQYGCPYVTRTRILVFKQKKVFIPNAITPNADFVNDGFTLFGNYFVDRIELLEVYNRWGDLLFRTEDIPKDVPELGWDGTEDGQPVLPGVYTYLIRVRYLDGEKEIFAGDVTVIR